MFTVSMFIYYFCLFLLTFLLYLSCLHQSAIKKAAEVEADFLQTIDKLEGEIKSREADIDKQKLEHQVSCVDAMGIAILRQGFCNIIY